MPRFRLRHQSSNLEMPLGVFLIGRSADCHLSIDDASVSRRHAALRVEPASVTVRDLGSRNGVRVNGRPVEGDLRLKHLDKIAIGNQEILFVDADQGGANKAATVELGRCGSCGSMNARTDAVCSVCGARLARLAEPQTVELRLDAPGSAERAEGAFLVVAGIADKAIALKNFEKAEQLLTPHLEAMLVGALRGDNYSSDAIDRAMVFALCLAEERSARRWLRWVFGLGTAARRLMDSATIDRLHEVVRKARYDETQPLREYLVALAALEHRFTPADRFLVKRLEALSRVIAA